MGHIEKTATLSAPADKLMDVITDPSTWGDWFTIHERWMVEPPATLTSGAALTAKIFMLGMANKIEWVVQEVTSAELILSGTGMAGVKATFTFALTPAGDNTEVHVSGEFEGSLIKGALGKAVEKNGTEQLQSSLDKLAALAAGA